ncbi:HNH endonuclease signature motif containing protein [Calidifontibacter indicus]|uniref:HNH nuclease domain-containing protein n=1 Tax=Calidifontibacter indicus TaxID=419650 RepID=A0A3D9UM97_9MICO|nr:HNH endonuclease signature motif containing protein [Calidifontibacter indicus]REF30578.1 hypothetical protein DFJ65_1590 [Calidifontibacter indicus]
MEGTPEFEARPGGIDPAELLESVIFEDGLDAAIELASQPHLVPGANPVTIMLIISKILSAHAYELLGQDDPFTVDEPDALLGYDLFPETTAPAVPAGSAPFTAAAGAVGGGSAGDSLDTDLDLDLDLDLGAELGTDLDSDAGLDEVVVAESRVFDRMTLFEDATRFAHQAAQSMEAVRARSIAEFARWEHPDGPQGTRKTPWVRHGQGFTSMYSADTVAAELGLGIQAGIGLVQRSARMVTRTPNLLREVAAGRANLDTAADIATELQDASPDVCETVEAEILGRGVHQTTRGQARKSCRTLVGKHQPSAARETARKTRAQQCGVFQDPHPTPGLSMLTIIGDNGQVTAVKDAIDQLAFAMKHGDESDKTLGEYRVDAFFDLAMRNVTLNLDIQVLTPTFGTAGNTWTKPANKAPTPADTAGSAGQASKSRTAGNDGGGTDDSGHADDSNTGNDDGDRAADGGRDDESEEGDAGGGPPSGPGPDTGPPSTPPAEPTSKPEKPAAFGGRNRDGRDFVSDMRDRGATSVHARAGAIDADSLADLARFADKVTVSSFEFDPVSGEPTANIMGSDSYRPPPTMARYVKTRDQRCRAPGCDRPAIKNVDLDHAVEWPQGPTATVNLECLCRRHHRMKQTQWRIRLHPNGIVEWTSPTGHTYRTTPGLTETWHDLRSD